MRAQRNRAPAPKYSNNLTSSKRRKKTLNNVSYSTKGKATAISRIASCTSMLRAPTTDLPSPCYILRDPRVL
ncbi:hypothetical protein B0H19DRAFT_1144775 [Mycena capillaripes]|nr:hypothetical protein B0H19DRAFT_1144775 [Mycena capillaripes]